jgi:hypothetical protein
MRLGVDENWRACWVAIGNPLSSETVDVMLGSGKATRFGDRLAGERAFVVPAAELVLIGRLAHSILAVLAGPDGFLDAVH